MPVRVLKFKIMQKTIILISILFLLFYFNAKGQNVKVIDAGTLKPIFNVYLYSDDKKEISFTEYDGNANISNFDTDEFINIQHPGYENIRLSKTDIQQKGYILKLRENVVGIDEVVVAVNKWEQNTREIPNQIVSMDSKEIKFQNPQTSADLLSGKGGVFVQKSQMGGGSPMIRGFAANRVLIVVDGVRMNNAIYRSGNLQNVISVDANSIENAEVIFGPGSVIYGSDALGGVMDFHTKSPMLRFNGKNFVTGNALIRYSSANNEKTGHFDFNFGKKKWGAYTSITYSDFGDLRMGSHKHNEYTRLEYVTSDEGEDTVVKNNDKNIQKQSGYSQLNILQKVKFQPSKQLSFEYAFNYSSTSDIPRYDRLIQYSGDDLKYAEWYYGPQKWMMNSLNFKLRKKNILYDEMKATVAYQNYQESRHDRKFGNDKIRERTEKVDVLSLNIDFDKEIDYTQSLYYGIEAAHNIINSTGHQRQIISNETSPYASRYPDDSKYNTIAAYLSYKNNINEKITVSAGLRFNQIAIDCDFSDKTYYDFPFNEINFQTNALNGSLGMVFRPNDFSQLNLNLSTGFRAPNIDDVGKVFDSEPGNVVVPNNKLNPEYAYNIDLGYKGRIGKYASVELTGFYTILKDAMVRRDFTFNGKDSIIYDGEMSRVQALVNADEATVYGLNFGFASRISKRLALLSNISWAKGEDKDGEPLRHVPPMFADLHLQYSHNNLKMDIYGIYNSEISFDNLAGSEVDKTHMYATDNNGNPYCPEWFTLNFKAAYSINKHFRINAGIENILDVRYRPYSSGIVAPGRNFILSFSAGF